MRRATALGIAILVTAVLAQAAPAIAEPAITWRVENPFRLFTDPAVPDAVAAQAGNVLYRYFA